MRQYLVEGVQGAAEFIIDRSKTPVVESLPSGGSLTRLPGRLSICDCINGNNRRYSRRVWEKNLTEGSILMESIKRNAAFGLLEHPDDGKVSLLSPISHHVTKAELKEFRDERGTPRWEVVGEITILETPEGKKLKALIDGGYNPLVSSRGYGSLVQDSGGVDDVQEDYVCEGWDTVIKPSFEEAELVAHSPGKVTYPAESKEAVSEDKSLQEGKESPECGKKPGPAKESAAATEESAKPQRKYMINISEIKGRVAALRQVDAKTLTPQRFAESLAEVEHLHSEVAKYVSEDSTRSYEGHKIHNQLEGITEGWNKAVAEPARKAAKLQENNQRLMQVVAATAKTGLTYKKRLGEAATKATKATKLNEELIRRGRGWRELAESRKARLTDTTKNFNTACESLDLIAERYHSDTTELGRQLIMVEFKGKITPEIEKKLTEATRLRHIAAIREELEGKKPAKKQEKQVPESKASKVVSSVLGQKPIDENKGQDKPQEGAKPEEKPLNENKDTPKPADKNLHEATVKISSMVRNPRSIEESVAMVQRLSAASAK